MDRLQSTTLMQTCHVGAHIRSSFSNMCVCAQTQLPLDITKRRERSSYPTTTVYDTNGKQNESYHQGDNNLVSSVTRNPQFFRKVEAFGGICNNCITIVWLFPTIKKKGIFDILGFLLLITFCDLIIFLFMECRVQPSSSLPSCLSNTDERFPCTNKCLSDSFCNDRCYLSPCCSAGKWCCSPFHGSGCIKRYGYSNIIPNITPDITPDSATNQVLSFYVCSCVVVICRDSVLSPHLFCP